MRLFGAALLVLIAPIASAAAALEPLVDQFVATFVRDVSDGLPVSPMVDVNELTDALECFSIWGREWTVREQTGDAATIDVTLYGRALSAGLPREETLLPMHWVLRAVRRDGAWQLDRAGRLERELAEGFVKDPTDAHWRALAARPKVDPDHLLSQIAAHNPVADPRHVELGHWVVTEARGFGSPPRTVADALIGALSAHNNKSDVAGGTKLAEELLQFALATDDPDLIADAHLRLGMNLWHGGDIAGALAQMREATNWRDRVRDPRQPIRAQHLIGIINEHQGNLSAAIEAGEATLREGMRFRWAPAICSGRFILGGVHGHLGNLEVALGHHRDALRCSEQRKHHGTTAMALTNLAGILMRLDRHEEAKPLLRRAIALSPGWLAGDAVSVMHQALGWILLPSPEAEVEFQTALRLAEERSELRAISAALIGLSHLRLTQKRYDEALAFADRAIEALKRPHGIARTVSGVLTDWPVRVARARALRAMGRTAEAEAEYRAAIDVVESQAEALPARGEMLSNFLDDKTAPYRELAALLADQNRGREAVSVSAWVKARGLRDLTEGGRVDLSSRMTAEERAQERRLESALHEANGAVLNAATDQERRDREREREEARLALEQFEKDLVLLRPELRARAAALDDDPLSWPAVAAAELILDYVVTEEQTNLFVIRRGEVEVHRIAAGRKELAAAVDELLARVRARDLRYGPSSKRLYELLLAPAERHFAPGVTIHIIPDDTLWNLPFHALRNARGKYLVETAAVHYAPSLGVLRASRPSAVRTSRTVLAIGNPPSSKPLPHAAAEVAEIARIHGASSTTVLTGNEALERRVKAAAPKFDILHFASHATPDNRRPLFSGILLAAAPGDGEDGILEARELLELDLRAELSVLAACATGTGRLGAAEGLIGLSWAFLVAGCPTTVATKWEVDSPATLLLMTDFHRHLRAGLAPAAALRAAQVKLMKDARYAHAVDWGAFVVLGVP